MATLQECQRRHDYAMADLRTLSDKSLCTQVSTAIEHAQKAFADLMEHHMEVKDAVRKVLDEETA